MLSCSVVVQEDDDEELRGLGIQEDVETSEDDEGSLDHWETGPARPRGRPRPASGNSYDIYDFGEGFAEERTVYNPSSE